MTTLEPTQLFADFRKLFPRGEPDPIVVFLRAVQGRDRSARRRENRVEVEFGHHVQARHFILEPVKEPRDYSGFELSEAIARKYNEDYWMLALWNAMIRNAGTSRLGTELVRAFVRHGVFLTAEELYAKGTKVTVSILGKFELADRVTYYKRLFDFTQVVKCLRMPERRVIVGRLREDKEARRAARIRDLPPEIIFQRLPEINAILGDSRLPEIAKEAREQVISLNGIVHTIYLQSIFWRNRSRLRAGLLAAIG